MNCAAFINEFRPSTDIQTMLMGVRVTVKRTVQAIKEKGDWISFTDKKKKMAKAAEGVSVSARVCMCECVCICVWT